LNERRSAPRRLSDYCQYLKGVGPVRAQRLKALGIETVHDLLTHYPRTYYDRRNLDKIADLKPGIGASVLGQILSVSQRRTRHRRSIVSAAVGDDTGVVQVVWFNQPYLAKHLKPGGQIVMSGELTHFRGARQLVNPEFEVMGEALDLELLSAGRIVPVYPLTAGVSQRLLRELIARILDDYGDVVEENLPDAVAGQFPGRIDALKAIHFPDDEGRYRQAVQRLKLEELFYLQLLFVLQRLRRTTDTTRVRIDVEHELERRFLEALPFELTRAQRRVLDEIHRDLEGERGMHRLLQGDVGCGKTIVAGAALLAAVEAGMQAALMVPTEILAAQHANTLGEYFEKLGVPVGLLIGSLPAREKREIQRGIATGVLPVTIGTHALIQEGVKFDKLGVVVIDEQHRFGVRQRAALLGTGRSPHMLVMTATPIPRTLALTAYADLDLSVIDEMPPGRAEVKTRLVGPDKLEGMYSFIRDELEKGAGAYLLYPLIDETEKQDLQAAVSAYEELSSGAFQGVPMGLLHGRMPFCEKETVMRQFSSGTIKLLVTTTVVEVGVHVPEATIMVIHHPERFGLSQIHQLRGRVGRGGRAGYCFLQVNEGVAHTSWERLRVLTTVADGFKIAEEDLKLRGPGEFFGIRQHGVPGLKLANPAVDLALVETARRHVKSLVESDPGLGGRAARRCRSHLRDMGADTSLRTVG